MDERAHAERQGTHSNVANAILVMAHEPHLGGLIAWDEFSASVVVTRAPPVIYDGGRAVPGPYPRRITDNDVTLVQAHIQKTMGINLSQPTTRQACVAAAQDNPFHPVRQWLATLEHDGAYRLDTWLTKAFGAEDTPYHRAVARKMLVAAVRRVRYPGCKFDSVPVLEGIQGAGKSRACRALASPEWFTDNLPSDLSDKDAQQGLAGKWIIELGEIQALARSSHGAAKAFFSRQVDYFRPPFGAAFVEQPRQCIFVGTTNEEDYLTDTTGNRRYWPVRCGAAVNVDWIIANREQLWAEAADHEADGEVLWIDRDDVAASAVEHQSSRVADDAWDSKVAEILREKQPELRVASRGAWITTAEIMYALGLPVHLQNRSNEMRVAAILRLMEWKRHQWRENKVRRRGWFAPGSDLP